MKKTIIAIACFVSVSASAFAGMPNDKVLRTFNATFAAPRNVQWIDHENYFEVNFVQSQIRNSVRYDVNGKFLGSIRYYQRQQLPANILCQLTSRFAGKTIAGVTEITTSESINYYVKMEDKKFWITVNAKGTGEMEVIEKFRKA